MLIKDSYVALVVNDEHEVLFSTDTRHDSGVIFLTKDRLRTTNLNWLLIFDNVTDKNQIFSYIPSKHSNRGYGYVLITSKNPLSWGKTMKIDKFTRKESIEALIKITGEDNKVAADLLADTLKDYPLAIVQAASYIKSHPGTTITEYKDLFLTKRTQLWSDENKNSIKYEAFDNYQFTVFTALSLTIKNLKTESPAGFDLLALCSLLDSKNIPSNILKLYATDVLKLDVLAYHDAISALVKYSLISDNHSQQQDEKDTQIASSFTMHELVQLTTLDLLSDREKRQYAQQGLGVFARFVPAMLDRSIPILVANPNYIAHMQTLSAHATKASVVSDNLFTVKVRLIEYYLPGKRDYPTALKLIDEMNSMISDVYEPTQLLKVRFSIMKSAYLAWHNGDFQRSLKEAQYAYNLIKNMPDHHEEHLMVYNRLAQLYNLLGDNDNALKYAQLGESVVRAKNDVGNQDTLFQNLAKIYTDQGNFDKALKYVQISISKIADTPDKLLPGDVPIYNTKYHILIKMGRDKEAYAELKQFYDNAAIIFNNKEHPFRSTLEIYYAYISFKETGANDVSKKIMLDNINILQKLLGDDNKKGKPLVFAHRLLAEIYESEDDFLLAREEYAIALQLYQGCYDDPDRVVTDDLSDLYSKMAMINAKLDDKLTANEYLRLHRSRFSGEHVRSEAVVDYMLKSGMVVGY